MYRRGVNGYPDLRRYLTLSRYHRRGLLVKGLSVLDLEMRSTRPGIYRH